MKNNSILGIKNARFLSSFVCDAKIKKNFFCQVNDDDDVFVCHLCY